MCKQIKHLFYLSTIFELMFRIHAVHFTKTIVAVEFPYYKIMFSLGKCKDRIIFNENEIWGSVRMNRILDIYYKSDDDTSTVSRVEINLVTNNTNCLCQSESDVGSLEFSAVIILPTNLGVMFYSLTIYSCTSLNDSLDKEETTEETKFK